MSQTKAELIDAKGNVAFDTNTLYVDATNNRVGVGTVTPLSALNLGDTSAESGIQLGDGADFTIKRNVASLGAQFNVGSDLNNYQFLIGGSERARIDSSGRLLVGTSSASGDAVIQTNTSVTSARFAGNTIYDYPIVEIKSGRAGSGFAGTFIDFKRDTEVSIGSINGSTASVSYNTTSDYRLKENVVPVADGIARLQQLKPCRFNFIIDPAVTIDGFIAHEAQAVVPECITGEKDAVDADGNPIYQGIDQSKLVPLLTAALQEAVGRIETLEAEVAALKAQ